jgi:hypothetical protein
MKWEEMAKTGVVYKNFLGVFVHLIVAFLTTNCHFEHIYSRIIRIFAM